MPNMNGKELRDRIKIIRPEIKVLFMSGYTSDVIVHHGIPEEGVHFIQKPFGLNDLARKIQNILGTP
jgi:FixJ family two-component response regulator